MSVVNPVTLPLSSYKAVHVGFRVEGKTAVMTFSRPERKNPLTFESYAEIGQIFRAAAHDKSIGAFVITGAGGNFSSGGDVFEIIKPLVEDTDTVGLLRFAQMTGEAVKAMRAAPQPVIAAVDGVCAGAGAIMAMASDIRIGTASTKVAFLFNRVGLAGCDMGACAILPRIIGQGRAADLLYSGRAMGGIEGEKYGFFARIEEPDALMPAALKLADQIARGPTFANAMTKRMFDVEWAMSVEQAIDAEAIAQSLCMATEDFGRAYRAFAVKEKPVFEGN